MNNETPKRIFVRYGNRKLHEQGSRKTYVSMSYLLKIVSSGESIQVLEDTTGKDLTAYTLGRLIFDRCRRDKDAFQVRDLQEVLMKAPLSTSAASKKKTKAKSQSQAQAE